MAKNESDGFNCKRICFEIIRWHDDMTGIEENNPKISQRFVGFVSYTILKRLKIEIT